MSKRHTPPVTLDDIRSRAREDATALVRACEGLNKAADRIGMNKGRLSFIHRGLWTQVAVNEIDLAKLETGRLMVEKDLGLTSEARELLGLLQSQMSDLHKTHMRLMRVMRRL